MARREFLKLGLATLVSTGAGPARAQSGLAALAATTGGSGRIEHRALDRLLARYLLTGKDGVNRVAYASWKGNAADRQALSAYIESLERRGVTGLSRPEQFAYWVNLYNAATLRLVLERYPVRSIRQIKPHPLAIGPWKQPVVSVGGARLSLDDIEHGVLRKGWREPRIHYAVNCASYGCPNLQARAYTGTTLETQLAEAAAAFVNHPRGARVVDRRLIVSSIYSWYKADFGGSDSGVIAHLRAHAAAPLRGKLAGITDVAGTQYDWALNDAAAA